MTSKTSKREREEVIVLSDSDDDSDNNKTNKNPLQDEGDEVISLESKVTACIHVGKSNTSVAALSEVSTNATNSSSIMPRQKPQQKHQIGLDKFFKVQPKKSDVERASRIAHLHILVGTQRIEDRGSIFECRLIKDDTLSHQDVLDVIHTIRHKEVTVTGAAHKAIFAYRLAMNEGHGDEGCDDDGEDRAGAKLLETLKTYPLRGVLVIVTRWFGGVLLGPARFVHIARVGILCLREHNLIPT